MLGNLIGGFVTILIGVTLVPSVANQVQATITNGTGGGTNVTGAANTIIQLTTLFFVLGVTTAGIAVAVQGLRAAGILGM